MSRRRRLIAFFISISIYILSSSSAFGSVRGNRPGSSLGNRLVQNHIDKDIYEAKSQSPSKLSIQEHEVAGLDSTARVEKE